MVICGASFDVLHLRDRTVSTAGGAGMYTAMAARRCGASVSLFAPRPNPCPPPLQPVADHLEEWLGPMVSPEELPQFEISYRQGKTEYLKIAMGAESMMEPGMLPADLAKYDHVHVGPCANARRQLAFVRACRMRGAKRISAGTYPADAWQQPQAVQSVLAETDIFFMNGREARSVFGTLEAASTAPGKALYITLGAEGARIIQGTTATAIPAVPTSELDPTGAGDTFCGATLAFLLQNKHPIMAARQAAALAAEMITAPGPTALLYKAPPPEIPRDPRVQVDVGQVEKVAKKIATLPEVKPFPFVSPELPRVGHPQALAYFFAATLQQFSFWSVRENRYERPLRARIGGRELKGSDYLWAAYRRKLEGNGAFCAPEQQARLSRSTLSDAFRADDGSDPLPALELHLDQARSYGADMLALKLTPERVLEKALASARPLAAFLGLLDQVGGYKEDPLRKKSALLALILKARPEKFLRLGAGEEVPPVIDYHLLRSCLRIGLIEIGDPVLYNKVANRTIVSPAEEWAIRYPAYLAIEQLIIQSGKSSGAVDWFFFNARQRCPEMTVPECAACQVDPVCAHRRELFQPVIRTSFY